jgi:hypothetical protein
VLDVRVQLGVSVERGDGGVLGERRRAECGERSALLLAQVIAEAGKPAATGDVQDGPLPDDVQFVEVWVNRGG